MTTARRSASWSASRPANSTLLVCMTGAGLAFLRDLIAAHMPVERLGAALRRATIVSRGPKPVPLLREMGVPVQIVVPEPNTWKEIVEAVASRPERRIAVQEYGRPNLEMNRALEDLGARVTPIAHLPLGTAGRLRAVARGGPPSGGRTLRRGVVYLFDSTGPSA